MRLPKSALFLAGAIAAGGIAQAQELGVTLDNPSSFGASSWTLGYQFSVSAPTSVTGLASFSIDSTMQGASEVGLWDSNGDLLASAWIGEGTAVVNNFGSVDIDPVALVVGDTYTVGAYDTSGDGYSGENAYTGFSYAPNFNYITDEYVYGEFADPTDSEGFDATEPGWFGGNVVLGSSVPDTAPTAVILLAGLAGLAAAQRRFRRSSV